MTKVKQSMRIGENAITRAKFTIKTKFEAEVIALIAGQVNTRKKIGRKSPTFTISLADLKDAPKDIKKAMGDLFRANIYIPKPDGFQWCPLFTGCLFDNNNISVSIHPSMRKHFKNLPDGLTHEQLVECLMIPSRYGRMVYRILAHLGDSGERYYSISNFRQEFEIPKGKYPNAADLQKSVLKRAKADINALTSMKFDYHVVKNGFGRSSEVIAFVLYFAGDDAEFTRLEKHVVKGNSLKQAVKSTAKASSKVETKAETQKKTAKPKKAAKPKGKKVQTITNEADIMAILEGDEGIMNKLE